VRDFLIWALIFAVTVAETWIATWEGRADRQSTSAQHNRFSIKSALWAGAFELVLFLDVWLIVQEGWPILIPILAGAVWGKYHALERRRRKWRARVKRKRTTAGTRTDEIKLAS
jgi:hypothetical protein